MDINVIFYREVSPFEKIIDTKVVDSSHDITGVACSTIT